MSQLIQSLKSQFKTLKNRPITRRSLLFAAGYSLVLSTILFSQQQIAARDPKVVRIVRSKQLTALAIVEKQGTLQKRLESLGYKLEWPEFAAGPQQLEALNAGGLDIASTAESPPVFSQAAGVPIVYLAATSANARSISLLVPVNSPIKSVKDLKGKKVAFQKASIGHYLMLKALEKQGLKLSDISSVYLQPSDAAAAFSQGKVDAWFIWEPFVTRTEQQKLGRVLIDGKNIRDTGNFYSTTRQFHKNNPQVIKAFLEELQKAEVWGKSRPKEAAQLLAPVTQLDVPTLEKMHSKYDWDLRPITEKIIKKQQEVADKWFSLGLIPKKVNVREAFLTPKQYAEITPKEILAKK